MSPSSRTIKRDESSKELQAPQIVRELLRKFGLKITGHRVAIYALLTNAARSGAHLSAEEVYDLSLKDESCISLATVYRVLGDFERVGIAWRHQLGAQRFVYELSQRPHHDHLVDMQSDEIIEFNDPIIERRLRELAAEKGYEVTRRSLVVFVQRRRR